MALKLFKKLFNIILVFTWLDSAGDESWLAVALVYICCFVVGEEVDGIEVNVWIFWLFWFFF